MRLLPLPRRLPPLLWLQRTACSYTRIRARASCPTRVPPRPWTWRHPPARACHSPHSPARLRRDDSPGSDLSISATAQLPSTLTISLPPSSTGQKKELCLFLQPLATGLFCLYARHVRNPSNDPRTPAATDTERRASALSLASHISSPKSPSRPCAPLATVRSISRDGFRRVQGLRATTGTRSTTSPCSWQPRPASLPCSS